MKAWVWLGALVGCLLSVACGPGMGPKLRVATATAEEIKAVESLDNVWYEFQPGDVVPVQLGFLGVMEGGSRNPAVFRAKQHFYFVMSKNGPMQVSFDGKTFAGPQARQSLIAVLPREDGHGGQLAWFIFMGESGDPKAALDSLIEQSKEGAPGAPSDAPASPPAAPAGGGEASAK